MTKIKIVDIKERVKFVAPGKRETEVDILYETAKGYVGTVSLPKVGFTEEKIREKIKRDMQTQEALLGTEITL